MLSSRSKIVLTGVAITVAAVAASSRLWAQDGAATAAAPAAAPAIEGADTFVIKGDPAQGEVTFKTYCALCHGPTGAGDGPGAAALNPKPRNFTDKVEMAKLSDAEIFKAIKEGGASVGKSMLMVAWGPVLGDDQKIMDVAAYVRTLAQ